MLYNILPEWLYNLIGKNFVLEFVYEIRVRLNKPILINYKGNFVALADKDNFKQPPICASRDLIEYILSVSTKQSLYAFNDEIKHCYITTDGGIRIGICGVVVKENGKVSTIKNITSLNIRISHQVPNCSENIINFICQKNQVKNTLIISPPSCGKTTLVRDIICKLSNEKQIFNILVVDERYEIAGSFGNKNIEVGSFVDVISGSDKEFAFYEALKTMSPSVIATDEISDEKDITAVKYAIKSGVKVIATAHAESINDLKYKKYFAEILEKKFFDRIIVLSKRNGVGTIEGVFDENLRCLFLPYMLWKFYYVSLLFVHLELLAIFIN